MINDFPECVHLGKKMSDSHPRPSLGDAKWCYEVLPVITHTGT